MPVEDAEEFRLRRLNGFRSRVAVDGYRSERVLIAATPTRTPTFLNTCLDSPLAIEGKLADEKPKRRRKRPKTAQHPWRYYPE